MGKQTTITRKYPKIEVVGGFHSQLPQPIGLEKTGQSKKRRYNDRKFKEIGKKWIQTIYILINDKK